MRLPFRIQTTPGDEAVLSVDGAFDAPGLNLSHWPGNATPADLRHDLSTGIALAFARLDAGERERRAEGCVALVNNHFDTDGCLAAFAVLFPDRALAAERALLDAAAAGDLFRCPTEDALRLDLSLTALSDAQVSPIASELRGLAPEARWERATLAALERIPRWLAGDFEPERALWEEPLARLREDRDALESAALDELVHLDAAVWTAPPGRPDFDPGRHALFQRIWADRVLVLAPSSEGTRARLVLSTKSFFDLVSERPGPRPDLARLAARLNEREGRRDGDLAWHHQDQGGASPELWFGHPREDLYPEHGGPSLAPSRLDPLEIKREVLEALRAVFVFPDDDEDDDL